MLIDLGREFGIDRRTPRMLLKERLIAGVIHDPCQCFAAVPGNAQERDHQGHNTITWMLMKRLDIQLTRTKCDDGESIVPALYAIFLSRI
jgi:hypothetical protein